MIRHKTARRIACEWHGGGGSALYALCSTGAIDTARDDHDVAQEIVQSTMVTHSPHAGGYTEWRNGMRALGDLLSYVRKHGPRGPVDGWGDMPW